jgi:hypothetical protein
MNKKFNWMPILRTGTFTDRNKQTVSITKEDLDGIVEKYNPSKSKANFVIEHPSFDEIGFGHPGKLKRVGDVLLALPEKVNEKFKSMVNSGKLPHRSVTLSKADKTLKNISFLPPKVKPAVSGLGGYEFASPADDEMLFEFEAASEEWNFASVDDNDIEFAQYEVSRWPFNSIERMFRRFKNFIITEKGLDTADKMFPEYEIEEAGNPPHVWEKPDPLTNQFSKPKDENNMTPEEIQKLQKKAEAADQLEAANAKLKTDLELAQGKLTANEEQNILKSHIEFCESDDVKNRVLPANKMKVAHTLAAIDKAFTGDNNVIEFSEGDNKMEVKPLEMVKELIKQLPEFEFSEIATGSQSDPELDSAQKTGSEIAGFANS